MDFEYKLMLIAKDAREKALEEGRKLGLEEGIEKGHKLGLEEGIEKGHKEGIEEGIEKGRKEATLANYSSLVQDGILSLSEAMKRSGLSEEEINGWIQTHPNT